MSQQPPGPPYGPPPYGYDPPPPPPKPGVVPLAPLDLGDIFGGALVTWFRNWGLVLSLSAALTILNAMIGVPFTRELLLLEAESARPAGRFLDNALPHLQNLALLVPVYAVFSAVVTGVAAGLFALVGREAVLGRRATWARLWHQVRPQLPRLVGVSLVVYLVAWLGLLFCFVPGVIVYVLWSMAIPALVTERLTVTQALGRSYRLVVGDGWRVFGVLLLVGLAAGVAAAVLSAPFAGTQLFLDSLGPASPVDAGWGAAAASSAAGLLGGTLTLAVLPFTALLLYVDQRIRRERYDLQLAQEAAPPPFGQHPSS